MGMLLGPFWVPGLSRTPVWPRGPWGSIGAPWVPSIQGFENPRSLYGEDAAEKVTEIKKRWTVDSDEELLSYVRRVREHARTYSWLESFNGSLAPNLIHSLRHSFVPFRRFCVPFQSLLRPLFVPTLSQLWPGKANLLGLYRGETNRS